MQPKRFHRKAGKVIDNNSTNSEGKRINVLHLGHSKKWRGGENQIRLIIEGVNQCDPEIKNYMAFPKGAIAFDRLSSQVEEALALPSALSYDLRSIFSIIVFCRKHNIDIINVHSGRMHSVALLIKLFLPQLKLVVYRHIDHAISTKYSTRKKYLSSRIDAFVAISSSIASKLESYGIVKNKIITIKSTIDTKLNQYAVHDQDYKTKKRLELIKQYGFAKDAPLIGFAAVLTDNKQPLFFVEICHQLSKKHNVNVLIAGDGPEADALNNYIIEKGLTKNIKLAGYLNDTSDFFSGCDIFVLPSKQEGLGTVLLEAINSQTLVVASNVGGIPEIIEDGETGFLADPSSLSSFVNALDFVISNPAIWPKLTKQAHIHVENNFSYDKQMRKTVSLYRHLVNG